MNNTFSTKNQITTESIQFDSQGLIPAIIKDYDTKEILMLGYMNDASLKLTINEGKVWFYSRSRSKLWKKGETSGNVLNLVSIKTDCDQDALLINVIPEGPTCHTGSTSCFFNTLCVSDAIIGYDNASESDTIDRAAGGEEEASDAIQDKEQSLQDTLQKLESTILDRKANPQEGSYTTYLFNEGLDKILKKVGEEASEVIIASKNEDVSELIYESSDLIYHLMVLMAEKGISTEAINAELQKRFK